MGGFFSADSLFGKMGTVLADVMILGLLWLLFSIPLVTVGAATSAVFYVTTKKVSKREGYLLRDFWSSFKQNFLKGIIVWLILVAIFGILIFNIRNIWIVEGFQNIVLVAQMFILIQVIFVTTYIFPLIARFDMKIMQLFRTALFMANRHFLTTILSIGLMLVILFAVWEMPVFSIFFMGAYCYVSSYLFVKVFKKYRPDLDPEEAAIGLNPLNLDDNDKKSSRQSQSQPVLNMDTLKNARSVRDDEHENDAL